MGNIIHMKIKHLQERFEEVIAVKDVEKAIDSNLPISQTTYKSDHVITKLKYGHLQGNNLCKARNGM